MKGKSDHGGGCPPPAFSSLVVPRRNASSVTIATAAPIWRFSSNFCRSMQTAQPMPFSVRLWAAALASRPIGASTRTRCSKSSATLAIALFRHERIGAAHIGRCARKNPVEIRKRRSDLEALCAQLELTDRVLVCPATLFDHRNRTSDAAASFEVTKNDDGIAQVAQVYRSLHVPHEPMLRQNHDRQYAELIEIGKEF